MESLLGRKRTRSRPKKLIFCALVLALVFAFAQLPAPAEYLFARGITRLFSGAINLITNSIPVSFYECTAVVLLFGVPAFAVALIVLLCKKKFARAGIWLYRAGMACLCVFFAFSVLYAPLYNRASCFSALGLSDTQVTEEKVYAAAEYYIGQLNELSSALPRDAEGNVVSPYSFEELAEKIDGAFGAFDSGYFASYEVRPKQVALSVPMSYLGITGIYFPFYAEANVNVNIPSYELPFTMAHETAHAKGVAHETEANIAAYVLCIRSDSAYIRYSGLMRAVANLMNSLPDEDYRQLYGMLDEKIALEYRNANAHYAKYEGIIDRISGFFNDIFLKANGVEGGTRSYGMTQRGLVSLYEQLVSA